ncbi:hypothetical protein SAMN05444377_11583 [Flavobacterium fontis]|uniref:Uncharacterized protein n=1 Tax=Flavobacterium fontis TaxID=1124188 RepID=A0A1M5DME8_9FLAO|nr:hypothetical protein [Flavobacterium fontis]SHF67952.1 hypothetical protein SAMN05444377_11583 [Flavobacterium fontis]
MRIILFILFLFIGTVTFSQSTNQIINIPDSLTYQKEIRVYKFAALTNYSELFRIYQKTDKSWNVEFFKCYSARNENEKSRFEKIQVTVKTDFDLLWLKMLNTNIENLADWDKIKYKLKKKGEITNVRGEYELHWQKVSVTDGQYYQVIVRNGDRLNKVSYSNPETYFEHYPEVDELNSFVELLNLLKEEFNELKE